MGETAKFGLQNMQSKVDTEEALCTMTEKHGFLFVSCSLSTSFT